VTELEAVSRTEPTEASNAVSGHLRGSSLLLGGRLLALMLEFAAHVVVVRHLAKAEYGDFAYALAVASLLSTVVVIGLPETLARYIPIFQENRERSRLIGSVVFSVGLVAAAGLACVAVAVGGHGLVGRVLDSDDAATLLMILILLVPTDGVNLLLQSVFASIGRVRAIFVRQYVLVPVMRLGVALALVAGGYGPGFLAVGWVATSVAGLLLYGYLGSRMLTGLRTGAWRRLEVPARELVTFALPVFLTNVFWIVLLAFSTILLGLMTSPDEVAAFQAVQPPARLNYLAMAIFSILFMPTVARLYARGRLEELREAYMATTLWIVILTFPVLALTTVFAPVFVPAFFGESYESSTAILVLMAAGYYLHTSSGPNSATMKVFRQLRYSVAIDLGALTGGVVLNLILIPIDGARGAALAFLLALIGRNAPYLWALRRVAGITLISRDWLAVQAVVLGALLALVAVQVTVSPPLWLAVVLCGVAGIGVLLACRRRLRLADTFPEFFGGRLGAVLRLR
jgi:O-antigen/teichoic acid export membrane protein